MEQTAALSSSNTSAVERPLNFEEFLHKKHESTNMSFSDIKNRKKSDRFVSIKKSKKDETIKVMANFWFFLFIAVVICTFLFLLFLKKLKTSGKLERA